MRLALVTTPPSIRSGIGDYTRRLLPHLLERAEVELFVAPGAEGGELHGRRLRSALELVPRRFDQVLYQLGNEVHHGFMARMVRALGGTVAQHDWVLFDLALAAFPALARGGWKGHLLALREGGAREARVYAANRRRRRIARRHDVDALPGTLLSGWHEPEPQGRWTGDAAALRLPAAARELELELHLPPGRRLRLLAGRRELARVVGGREALSRVACATPDEGVLVLEARGLAPTAEQLANGDARRLGAFVRAVRWRAADGARDELDLTQPATRPPGLVQLADDRFRLPLNRSVVRHADAFVVHSQYVRRRILESRNALTAVAVVPHGADPTWGAAPREAARAELAAELPDLAARGRFLVVCFGAVQPHKRVDVLLRAVARARRERPELRVAVVGTAFPDEYDAPADARELGLGDAAHFAGWVDEARSRVWLAACDLAVNLRGPTSGGTSGGAYAALAAGRGVVVSGAGEQSELPDGCALKVAHGEGEVDALARLLVDLAGDPSRRAELERAAREYVETECSWSRVAHRYLEALEVFPRPRSARPTSVWMRVRARLAELEAERGADPARREPPWTPR